MKRHAIVLAAGKGSRMKSCDTNYSKVAYPILGKAIVNYVLDALSPLKVEQCVVVVGFGGKVTESLVKDRAKVVWQHDLLGTGHAVMQTASILKDEEGSTIIVCGDTPLITTETIEKVFYVHDKTNNALTVVSAVLENPHGYGRIIREKPSNRLVAIREDKDCNTYEKDINEVNTGIYVFENKLLFKYLDQLTNNNAQSEYYLTDLVELFVKNGHKVGAYVVENAEEMFGINDRTQLAYAGKVLKKRINHKLMLSGVSIEDPDTAYIGPNVRIGRDTIILPNTTILGETNIAEANTIGPNVIIEDSTIGSNNQIVFSRIKKSKIGSNNIIKSFTDLNNVIIGDNKES